MIRQIIHEHMFSQKTIPSTKMKNNRKVNACGKATQKLVNVTISGGILYPRRGNAGFTFLDTKTQSDGIEFKFGILASKVHEMGKGCPDPGNGAAGPETLLNNGFREGSFCAKTYFHTLSLLVTKALKVTK